MRRYKVEKIKKDAEGLRISDVTGDVDAISEGNNFTGENCERESSSTEKRTYQSQISMGVKRNRNFRVKLLS